MAILCVGFWKGYYIVTLALSVLSCGAAFYFTKTKFSPLFVRGCLLLYEILWQYTTFSSQNFGTHLILFNLPTLSSDILLLYCWYLHLGISTFFSTLRMIAISDMTFSHLIWEMGMIGVTTTVHGFIERAMKENWVLFDSYKKSEKIYMKLADEIAYPVLIADSNGKVYYFNKKGGQLFRNLNVELDQKMDPLNAISLVHPESKKDVEEAIKKAVKEPTESFEVPIITSTPQAVNSGSLQGYDSNIITQGFQFYRLLFERIPWKASNCVMITCENTTSQKLSYERLLNRCLANRQRLKQVYSNVEVRTIQKKRDNDIQTLIAIRNLIQENEFIVISAMKHLNQTKLEINMIYIVEELQYIMELYVIEAHKKEIKVIFESDPCTPNVVVGDCGKFFTLIQEIYTYFIWNTEKAEIKLSVRLVNPISSGWKLGFEFTTMIKDHLNTKEFLELYESNIMGNEVLANTSERLSLCKIIIKELQGSINVSEGSEGKFSLSIEIPFESSSNESTIEAPPRLCLYETTKLTEYRVTWLNKPISPPPKKDHSVSQNEDLSNFPDETQNLLNSKKQAQAVSKLNKNASELKNSVLANIKAKIDSASASPTPSIKENQVIESGGKNQLSGAEEYLSPGFDSFPRIQKEEKKSTFCEIEAEEESSGEVEEEELTSVNCLPRVETPKSKQSLSKKSAIKRRKLKWRRFMAGQDLEMPENQTERRKNQLTPTQKYQDGVFNKQRRALWKKDQIFTESKQEVGGSEELKVLIVEDNAFNILPIQTTLKRHKIPYDLAYNGMMAVDRFEKANMEKCRYGVIFMDIEMPIMNGFEATTQIRKIEKSSHLPRTYICGLSAHQNDDIKQPCLNCGMDLYVTKPVSMDQVLKIINKQLAVLQKKKLL